MGAQHSEASQWLQEHIYDFVEKAYAWAQIEVWSV